MDQIPPPGPPRQFHIRMVSIISLLMLLDFLFVSYSLETILLEGVSAMIIFASEFVILQATIAGSAARYAVGVIDLRRARGREEAPVWEAKSTYLFYIDLSVGQLDFLSLTNRATDFLQTSSNSLPISCSSPSSSSTMVSLFTFSVTSI